MFLQINSPPFSAKFEKNDSLRGEKTFFLKNLQHFVYTSSNSMNRPVFMNCAPVSKPFFNVNEKIFLADFPNFFLTRFTHEK